MEPTSLASLTPYFLAIASNLCFGTASLKFSQFASKFSSAWMNQVKVTVALIGFITGFLILENYATLSIGGWSYLLASGIIGLFLGDWFLFQAFANLGATRTLVLYSFQPFLLGVYGFIFLNQSLNGMQIIAILCMVGCVFTFLIERSRTLGHWDLKNFSFAFLGIFFDALGVVLSRQAYEASPGMGSFQANGIRALGAAVAFFILKPSSIKKIYKDLKTLSVSNRNQVIGASFLGTFISLSLYLQALKTAHVASLTAISITGPIWVSIIEHIREKKVPNRYLWVAFSFFLVGFGLMSKAIIH